MKKQLTVFAAAAMLVSFATAAIAATPTFSLTGKFDYSVEYNATDYTWTNPADSALLLDPACVLSASVATTGDPNLGTISLTLWQNGSWGGNGDGTAPGQPTVSLSGGFYGGTLKLGNVSSAWEGITNGGGVGASYSRAFDAITVDAVTGAASQAAKVAVKLSGTNSVYGGFNANADWSGLAFAGANFAVGPATIAGEFAAELKGDNGTGLLGTATVQATDALKLSATVVKADVELDGGFLDIGLVDAADKYANEFGSIGWASQDAWDGGMNYKVRGDLVAIKDVMAPYVEYKSYADASWKLAAGTNFSTIYLNKAEVTMDSAENTTVTVDFSKAFGGVTLAALAGYTVNGVTEVSDTYAYVKASKTFGWLSTWASFGIHDFAAAAAAAKVGASASFTF